MSSTENKTDFSLLLAQLEAVTQQESDTIANLANASAVLNMSLEQCAAC